MDLCIQTWVRFWVDLSFEYDRSRYLLQIIDKTLVAQLVMGAGQSKSQDEGFIPPWLIILLWNLFN